jgi:hypothetical protein
MSDDVGGRPIIEIDIKLVQKLCEIQCTGEEIASVLGISYSTLYRKVKDLGYGGFDDLYKKNSQIGKASLRRLQWGAAVKGNVSMQIWLGKQYLSQKDRVENDITTKDVTPKEPPTIINHFVDDPITKQQKISDQQSENEE